MRAGEAEMRERGLGTEEGGLRDEGV